MALNLVFETKDLCFGFEKLNLFQGLNLQILAQERVALVGPSGAGKTTLLKSLAGLIPPHSGQIYFLGNRWHEQTLISQTHLRKKMSLLFQKNALFDSMTVLENLTFSLIESEPNLSQQEVMMRAESALESVKLNHVSQLYPDQLSGGMQKRLGIARAQILKPQAILYDDPTAGLDPITSRQIIDLIMDLQNQTQSTIVIVTNEMARAYQVATRILYLDSNGIVDLGSPELAKKTNHLPAQLFLQGRLV